MKNLFVRLFVAATLLVPASVNAQVTIGSGKVPENFSVLELDNPNNKLRGLRLPRLTAANITALENSISENPDAKGLRVYNMDENCVWTWDGTAWIKWGCEGECIVINESFDGTFTPPLPTGQNTAETSHSGASGTWKVQWAMKRNDNIPDGSVAGLSFENNGQGGMLTSPEIPCGVVSVRLDFSVINNNSAQGQLQKSTDGISFTDVELFSRSEPGSTLIVAALLAQA